VEQIDRDDNYRVTLNSLNFTLAANATTQLTVRVDGARLPAPGVYDGWIVVTGTATEFRIPYTYVVPDNVPFNIYPLSGDGFVRTPGERVSFTFKVLDQFGAPAIDAPIRLVQGKANDTAAEKTDVFGIGFGRFNLSNTPGPQSFAVTVGNLTQEFAGAMKARPTIPSAGIVDAATGQASTRGYAPGSYISLFGSGLSDILKVVSTPYLPLSLAGVSVSFDNPQGRVSVPGRLHFVSPGQINVQIPWECRGLSTVTMKVAIGDVQSATFDIRIVDQAPGAFEYTEANNQRSIAALSENFTVIGANNPALRGRPIQLYFNGLGDVSNRPGSGDPAGSVPLASTRDTPSVSIGGRNAQVLFSGLAPGLVGVYQVNVIVPPDASGGRQSVGLTINGISARNSFISIQP
jgi:minor extracellular serine protease Vpr